MRAGWRRRLDRISRWFPLAGGLLVLVSIALPLAFLIVINVGAKRSFLIEARTSEIILKFGQGPNRWRLPTATLCRPVDIPRPVGDDVCGVAFAPDGQASEWIIDWVNGDTALIRIQPDGVLEIASEGGTHDIPPGGHLIVDPNLWTEVGTLLFQAEATLGADLATGTRHYLWSGNWEAREAGLATNWIRSQTEVVKSGYLSAGATVDVMIGDASALIYGHIARRDDDGPMDVMMLSEFADTSLLVRHYGVGQAVRIKPDWVDIAISSPLLIALAAFFPVLGGLGFFLFEIERHLAPPRSDKPRPRPHYRRRGRMRHQVRR